jgi:hypothetical protein
MAHRRCQRGSDILKWTHIGPGLGGNLPSWIPSKILTMASGRATPASVLTADGLGTAPRVGRQSGFHG